MMDTLCLRLKLIKYLFCDNRKCLLIVLNIVLVIFVILEISILNTINSETGNVQAIGTGNTKGNFSKG